MNKCFVYFLIFKHALANYVIRNSTNRNIQESAYYLLDGCAKYRYSAENYLREINIYYPMLGN